jgi:hypothetical protein
VSEFLGQGLHLDINPMEYHADTLTPEPALSSSGIRTLLTSTPAHFRARNARLSPWDVKNESTDAQSLGTVIHRLILGRGGEFVVLSGFDDWRTKAAQIQRKDAIERGLVPILEKTHDQAQRIAGYGIEALRERFGGWPIGESEVVGIWRAETENGPVWKRMLIDHWSERAVTVLDVKTTARPIADEDLARKFATEGGDIQAAHYTEGISTIFPKFAGLVQFQFVVIEVEPPFAVRFVKLNESWLTRARFRTERASNLFAECIKNDRWPAWTDDVSLSAPSYLETKWEYEELEGVAV